jgi:superkiller protein 3
MGYALRNLGRYPEAISEYQEAIREKPDMGLAYLGLGDVYYYNTKQYADAANAYKRGLELRPGNATAQYNLGWCYNDLERYSEAVEELRKAVSLQPNYPEAHNEMGYALHQLGRYAEAVQQYQIAIQQKTDYASAHYNLGMSFLALHNRNGALQQYRILQRIDNARATKLFNAMK